MAEAPTFVEQALHGYRHGHELLAASSTFDNATANLLSHNSDSAPSASLSDGPFLTGYPLPDGRYVIARTWVDEVADRPNTVITFSLIVPAEANSSFSMEQFLEHLSRPPQPSPDGTLPALDLTDFARSPLQLNPEEAIVAAEFYVLARPLHVATRESRERIALAVWQQLWRSARFSLQFCTAPDTDRFAKTQRPLRFQTDSRKPPPSRPPACIIEDFQSPGPFREFAHFVGSGERAVGLMQPFAVTYTLLHQGDLTPDAFTQVLNEYKASEPRRLRRLKRRVVGVHRGESAWRIPPFDLLDALATHDLGSMIYASDAALDVWLMKCWDLDPGRTVDALRSVVGAPAPSAGPPTAREGLGVAFESNVPDLITPNTVAIVATLHRDTVLQTIWSSNNPALWAAWADLDPPIEVPYGIENSGIEWEAVLRALRPNASAVGRVLRRYPEVLDHVIRLADREPLPSDLIVDLTRDAKRLIRYRLEHDDLQLLGLARLADERTLPRALRPEPWTRTVKKSKDEVLQAVGYLISREGDPAAVDVAVQTFANLYKMLSGAGGTTAWKRLDEHIRGDRGTWDRCGRLTEDFVRVVRHYPMELQVGALTALRTANPTASKAVEQRIRSEVEKEKRKKFRIWDPTTW
jgi:hypothetical protein